MYSYQVGLKPADFNCMGLFLNVYSVSLVDVSDFMPLPWYSDYDIFVLIWKFWHFVLFFFFKIDLAI